MKWIVCFSGRKQTGFYRFFTKKTPKFTHCHVMRYDAEADVWIWLEYHSDGLRFRVEKSDNADYMINVAMEKFICIEVEADKVKSNLPQFQWPWLYCVTFCKHVVGVNKWWILTPYALYCELLKRDGTEIFISEKGEAHG